MFTITTQDKLNAMSDSVKLINSIVSNNTHSEEYDDAIRRNYEHLEIMLAKSEIINYGVSLTTYIDAVHSAKVFVGE